MAQQTDLEQALRNFDTIASPVDLSDPARQVWRFEFSDKGYRLYFRPRQSAVKRMWSVSPITVEFLRLQQLQRNSVPAVRAVANLVGFHIRQQFGDAMIVQEIPGSVRLDLLLQNLALNGKPIPHRKEIAKQIVQIVKDLGTLKFGHRSLSLASFLIRDGREVFLEDVSGLRNGGMRFNHIFDLAADAARFATRTDLLRAWQMLSPDTWPPKKNPRTRVAAQRVAANAAHEGKIAGAIRFGEWSGLFTAAPQRPKPWSVASRLSITHRDWEKAWPTLLAQIESEQLTPLKRDASGEVLGGEVILAGVPIQIVVKRPRRKRLRQYAIDLLRPARAQRMWNKAWTLIGLNLPCEWPMLIMQRKTLGYTTDAMIVFERVPGHSLDQIDLDTMEPSRREMLFRRAGRILRAIEQNGLVHYDSKSTNWIVYEDEAHGAIPVMIDPDGIRPLNYWLQMWSIHRLLRAMKQHRQYTPADSLALCRGFAPFTANIVEEAEAGTSDGAGANAATPPKP